MIKEVYKNYSLILSFLFILKFRQTLFRVFYIKITYKNKYIIVSSIFVKCNWLKKHLAC